MDWKKVKVMLIVLFLFINLFLIYMLYNKNIKGYVDTITAIETVFNSNNVTVIPDLRDLTRNARMDKLLITNNNGLTGNFMITLEDAVNYKHIGVKKEIVNVTVVLSNFIRDFAPKNLIIKNISLGYFFNSSQVNENVVSGEAEPCWVLETNDATYIYNAYNGILINFATIEN